MERTLAALDSRAAAMIRFRLGLDETGVPHTLSEVADAFGVTVDVARELERQALRLVRSRE
jgi:DNA-directed RNA polymerase sigma subunit (sigma70/sigma32)